MSTYGTMQDNVRSLLSRADLDSLIPTAIQQAIKHYERKPFWFNEGRTSLSCSSGASEYTLSASFVAGLTAIVTYSGNSYEIGMIPEQRRLAIDTGTSTGLPSYFSVFANRFLPYPAPNQDYTIELPGTRRQSTLSATTDSNNWSLYAQELIEQRALWWLHAFKTRNTGQAQVHKSAEIEALSQLETETLDKNGGKLIGTKF